jgi:hypothetical protein
MVDLVVWWAKSTNYQQTIRNLGQKISKLGRKKGIKGKMNGEIAY